MSDLKLAGQCVGSEIVVETRAVAGRLSLSDGLQVPEGPVEVSIRSLQADGPPFSAQRKNADAWETVVDVNGVVRFQ